MDSPVTAKPTDPATPAKGPVARRVNEDRLLSLSMDVSTPTRPTPQSRQPKNPTDYDAVLDIAERVPRRLVGNFTAGPHQAFPGQYVLKAAGVLLTKVQRWSWPKGKGWGTRLATRIRSKKARIAIARKIAVLLRCGWTDGTEFW